MQTLDVSAFVSFTLAILLLFAGKALTHAFEPLRRYSIPESVIGGFICAAATAILYYGFDLQPRFELEVRDLLLLYFFAAIGLRADLSTLLKGGRALTVLLALATTYILAQNLLGMGLADAFGLDAKAGLMLGSISLTGGVGTTLAWSPYFIDSLGIDNALELGIAANTMGLIAACLIGGPIARYLLTRHRLPPPETTRLDVGLSFAEERPKLDYYGVLWAWMWLNLTLLIGEGLHGLLARTGLTLPEFVSCLMAGIALRNGLPPLRRWLFRSRLLSPRTARASSWLNAKDGLALISDICLGLFLTMALMGLRLWELEGLLGLILLVIGLQVLMCVAFTLLVVFRLMGRDYEAAVICSGFGGIALGSTATAIVNMTAVTQQYGAAHRAFILVPLVCGFFIDLVNALIINLLVTL
ncbi:MULTISPECIES: sodium/glutamate symporter [unclassified Pseudomonas]|uniref:sodium/glutamate symporter n=1 Tax=unclassified Pseudomonas TaxID=196821 RepID=UPI002447B7BB|nr:MULTISPECIES: sodium/glutamate symporter [unclassified Pseudomonas]MDG9929463.1 sodium/glutamate symporter [Pseudomonas sp. GD04042]MDH0483659.1 sodium/glutamate symporter [Pseudomonas sp. GD04015]MDH0606276.1 sodium/glutamate symporter [Pseudomonas sp. GD03869]